MPTARSPRPDDLYRLRVPIEPRLSPAGDAVAVTVLQSAPAHDGYRSAIWYGPVGPAAEDHPGLRRLTTAGRSDGHARFAPDGRSLAFLSDRRLQVEEEPAAPRDREDGTQVHVLPLDGPGEARRVTDLPRGVDAFEWSPDGRYLAVISASREADRAADDRARRRLPEARPGTPPPSDYWFFDRLGHQLNGAGVIANRTTQLWIVDLADGHARRLTDLPTGAGAPAWSPDGRRIAITTGSDRSDHDLHSVSRILVVDRETGRHRAVADHPRGIFFAPAWRSDTELLALGGDQPHVGYRSDIWAFAADGSEARAGRNLSGRHDLMPGSTINSDVAVGEGPRLAVVDGGRAVLCIAPVLGSMELWRLDTDGGDLERLTNGEHAITAFDAVDRTEGTVDVAAIVSSPTDFPEVHHGRIPGAPPGGSRGAATAALARVSRLNAELRAELELRPAVARTVRVDGHDVQGWLMAAGDGARPTVVEIHGGPHTLYGWTPMLEFQVLAASGISVFACNPRGSEGYGLAFNEANLGDWGDGPMRDVIAGVDALVADGLADPNRLGVTGGSYGGYLTTWIVAHDTRFRAAITCRSVADLSMLMLTGDLGGTDWAKVELGAYAWEDPDLYRRLSPITWAPRIRTPLLIQHAENDLRTTLGQAEALFSVLRRHRRPVRLMRVPGETHELTRAGTPFRRAENLVQVRDWFHHFLVDGRRNLPRRPRTRHGD